MAFSRDPDAPPPAGGPEGRLDATVRIRAERSRAPLPGEETDLPALDIYETAGELVIEAEVPGVDPALIEVFAGDGVIVIEGMKEEQLAPGRVNFLCMERAFGSFRRAVPLGRAVDLTRASASCAGGVLQVRVPKVEEKRGGLRAIPVRRTEHRDERSEP